jgi:LytS/YehU family sensor histidine kinase
VKHGLAPLKSGGLLRIEVTQSNEKLEILIADNGVGREHSAKTSGRSTGLGLSLMDDFNALYQKLFNQQISSYIRDLKTVHGKPAGTSVQIIIGMQYEPKRI